ncbi:hypothetical protein [Cupriavidus pauculus]|uniref:hypothetical protein n=1 Tax=Cupriavidus pauculus TaxID=82633 RepID=UPI001D0C68E5|nr:hypothetical protein [Cupriavidus pauculus]
MNSNQRRKAMRASPYKPGTSWVFRGKRLTVTRVVSPTEVHAEWEDGSRSYASTRTLAAWRVRPA